MSLSYLMLKCQRWIAILILGHGSIYRKKRVVDTPLATIEMQTNAWIEQSTEQLVHFLNNTGVLKPEEIAPLKDSFLGYFKVQMRR